MKFRLSDRRFQWVLIWIFMGIAVYSIYDQFNAVPSASPVYAQMKDTPSGMKTGVSTPAQLKEHKPLSNRLVEYHMNVEYVPDVQELRGQQVITWKNPGSRPVDELYLHTYPNAFASNKTTFMRESGGKLRQDKAREDSMGWMKLTAVRTQLGQDLTGRMWYVQPDDGNIDDHTLLKISLPEAVNPGDSITLETQFTVKLPYVFARMGYADDFVMAGQWFPKVAVYEPKGMRGRTEEGWNLHQYHGSSEFYADFGIYNVKIKVPSNYTVAATGFQLKPAAVDTAARTKTYNFYADDVHDFAWSASPDFLYFEEPFAAKKVPGVKIKLYLDPRHAELKERYFTAAKKALARFSEWYGEYPYTTLSIVVPPSGGNGAGGMEYPTLVTAWAADKDSPGLELERVIVHEIGHQFWYGIVASNEFEEAWLDEGITSYAEDAVMEAEYGIKSNLPMEASYITSPESLKRNSWEYRDHRHYADNVYIRAKLVLREIESIVGKTKMRQIMQTYFERWKFKHPTTRDFQTVIEDVTKERWDDFFNQYVYGPLMMDFSVDSIRSKKKTKDGTTHYESTVLIRKRGGSASKVPILFHFADGQRAERVWEGTKDKMEFKLYHTHPVDWVMIDPDYSLVLENKRINNFYQKEIDPKWQVRWNLGMTQFIQTIFSWMAW